MANNFSVDSSVASERILQTLQHTNTPPLRNHNSIASSIEGTAGNGGIFVSRQSPLGNKLQRGKVPG